jgi:hypothetical protein
MGIGKRQVLSGSLWIRSGKSFFFSNTNILTKKLRHQDVAHVESVKRSSFPFQHEQGQVLSEQIVGATHPLPEGKEEEGSFYAQDTFSRDNIHLPRLAKIGADFLHPICTGPKRVSFPNQFLMVIIPPHGRENRTVGIGKAQPFLGPHGRKMYERLGKCCLFHNFTFPPVVENNVFLKRDVLYLPFSLALIRLHFLSPFCGSQLQPSLQSANILVTKFQFLTVCTSSCFSEMSVSACKTLQSHNPEDHNTNSHCHENLTLYMVLCSFLICFSFTVEYHPGGAAQNTLRIFQWLISYPHYSVFFGAIGNDDEGKLIEKLVKNSGVETRYT